MNKKTPTLGAQRRFERLEGMLPATVALDREGDDGPSALPGTIVDISAGCLCIRVPLGETDAELMRTASEGDFVETQVVQENEKHWTVLGHVAWLWIPSMVGEDTLGSLGIDIAGVIEDDPGVLSKLGGLIGVDHEVSVDRSSKKLESPARRRERERLEHQATSPTKDEGDEGG